MFLNVTIKSKPASDFVRTVEVSSAKDFSRVERAAAAWAKLQLRSMPLFGHVVRRELNMQIEWVETPAPQKLIPQQTVTIKVPRRKKKK